MPDDILLSETARRSYEDLILWQKAMDLAVHIYKATAGLPRSELFGLVSQMRRACASIPSNIAEGSARRSTKEFLYFLQVARGSMAELEIPVLLAQRIGYLPENQAAELKHCIDDVGRILSAVITGLRRRLGERFRPAPSP